MRARTGTHGLRPADKRAGNLPAGAIWSGHLPPCMQVVISKEH